MEVSPNGPDRPPSKVAEDRLWRLKESVSLACDQFFLKRGLNEPSGIGERSPDAGKCCSIWCTVDPVLERQLTRLESV
jgi:hypothetical protein